MNPSPENPNQDSAEEPSVAESGSAIARFFHFAELGTNFRTELVAGVTTFITMAYILVANPAILSNAIFLQESGDLFGELVTATALSAALATAIAGLLSNYPFALAPGMGLNAFFAFTVVLQMGVPWPVALAAVLVEGILFIVLTLTNVRSLIITTIPDCLKRATATGIGLFIAYIALAGDPDQGGAGLILADETTKTTLGNFANPQTLMAAVGIVLVAAFVARRVKGALLMGILATALLSWILAIVPWPSGLVGFPIWPTHLAGQAWLGLQQLNPSEWGNFITILLVFLFVDLFDTVGTLSGVGIHAGFIDESGELPRANQSLLADAIGTSAGALLGTSTVTTYVESASGVAEGGRSGFTAIAVAGCFLCSIFFVPMLSGIPGFATAPALLMVGVLMAGNVAGIRWSDPAESIPCFLTILVMPLSFSIAEGLAVGFITYPLLKAVQGKFQETSPALWILAIVFILRFALMSLGVE